MPRPATKPTKTTKPKSNNTKPKSNRGRGAADAREPHGRRKLSRGGDPSRAESAGTPIDVAVAVAEQKRIIKLEGQLRRLKARRAERAMDVPTRRFPDAGINERRGSVYRTYFKAEGSFSRYDIKDSYAIFANLLDEEEPEAGVPAAFYSSKTLGRVLWMGVKDRERIISDLNRAGGFGGDFRDIYPRWDYEYQVTESIGGVIVQVWNHRAKRPLTRADRRNGWLSE